ncbi:MAG: Do family serine endopeptidase [Planctomycetes bacterium]|nr:Do family serine endopeptidase [Planctomycetota bacterium]
MSHTIFKPQKVLGGGLVALALIAGLAWASRGPHEAKQAAATSLFNTEATVQPEPTVSPEEAAKATASAKDLSTAFRWVSQKTLPSVVAIETTPKAVATAGGEGRTPHTENPFGDRNPFEGTPFGDMFRDSPFGKGFQIPPMPPQGRGGGLGSGVIVDSSGVILTNNHVVAGDGEVTVRLSDGREFKAAQVWTDPKTDIAVVKIDGATDLVAAPLGNSDSVAIGDWVLALGQPFGLESTVTAGIISAKHRGIGITARENFLQTDAAINPGNSGGPLVNLDGEVVGINTAISSRSGGNDGVGFAVPVNLAKWVANQLLNGGTVHRAYLGVGIQPVTQQLADKFNVKPREGVVVTDVYPNTPAAKAGLKAGDVIVAFAGVKISSPQELQIAVERAEVGKSHAVSIVREGKRMDLGFTPEEQPADFGARGKSSGGRSAPEASKLDKLGLEISSLDPAVAERLGMKGVEGVVITGVQSGSRAERAGLQSGMVITEVNRHPVKAPADIAKAISGADSSSILLLVRSAEGSRFVVVQP